MPSLVRCVIDLSTPCLPYQNCKIWLAPASVFCDFFPSRPLIPSSVVGREGSAGGVGCLALLPAGQGEPKLRGEIGSSLNQTYHEVYCQGYPEGYQVHNKLVGKLDGNFACKVRQR